MRLAEVPRDDVAPIAPSASQIPPTEENREKSPGSDERAEHQRRDDDGPGARGLRVPQERRGRNRAAAVGADLPASERDRRSAVLRLRLPAARDHGRDEPAGAGVAGAGAGRALDDALAVAAGRGAAGDR